MNQAHGTSAARRGAWDVSLLKPAFADRILIFVFYTAFSVYLAAAPMFSLRPAAEGLLAAAFILFGAVLQVRLIGSFSGSLGYSVTVLTIALISGSWHLAALVGVLITAACSLGWLCLTDPSPFLGIPPLLAYLLTALVLRDPVLALAALLPLPCALTLAEILRRQIDRVGAICRLALTLAGTVAVFGLLLIGSRFGIPSPALLREGVAIARRSVTAEVMAYLQTTGLPHGVNGDIASYATSLVNTAFHYLPALTVLLFTLLGWLLHSAMMRVARGHSLPRLVSVRMMSFDMSIASAVLYGVSLLLSHLPCTGKAAIFPLLCANLCLCLIPGMMMTARIATDFLLWRQIPSCLGSLFYLILFFLFFAAPAVMIPLFASFGAGVILVSGIRRHGQEKKDTKG